MRQRRRRGSGFRCWARRSLFDPAVPPPGQFAVTNALNDSSEVFILKAGHHTWEGTPEEEKALRMRLEAWFGEAGEAERQ